MKKWAIVMIGLTAISSQVHAACTRQALQAAVDSYLAAQKSGDRSKMTFTEKPKLLENMRDVAPDRGLWNTALPIAFSRSFLDEDRCKSFSEVIVTEGSRQYVIGTRLTLEDGKVAAIDSLVTKKGDWLFNANNYLKFSSAEDWHPLSAAERIPKQHLIDAGNQYLDQFSDKLVEAPWGTPCARLEGGAYTDRKHDPNATCKVGIPPGVLYIVNRDYVVDEQMGVVNIFCRFGNSEFGMPDSHTFRLVNGKLRYVHTLSVSIVRESPQTPDY
ncbi:MAG TPA: hypothetical protein VMG11_01400 [Steroidobacteraceae bacterium]|nr:hypothetical protein [Steroidobacteraceae bacterium]